MSKVPALRKITRLEAELKALKRVITDQPNLEADAKAWKKIGRSVRNARKRAFRKFYGAG